MDKESTLENLKDAGCDLTLINEFFNLQTSAQLRLLTKHKLELLENLHNSQKKIDCLDYLIFYLKQDKKI